MNSISYAILASILWGLGYTIIVYIADRVAPLTIMVSNMVLSLPLYALLFLDQRVRTNLTSALKDDSLVWLLVIEAIISFAAIFCIVSAIGGEHPIAAAFIEISYPLFLVVFSYFLLSGAAFNVFTVVGGALIFAGVALIKLKGL